VLYGGLEIQMAKKKKIDWFEKAKEDIERGNLYAQNRSDLLPEERVKWEVGTAVKQARLLGFREGIRALEDITAIIAMNYPQTSDVKEIIERAEVILKQYQDEVLKHI
jgi:hypothetical protein